MLIKNCIIKSISVNVYHFTGWWDIIIGGIGWLLLGGWWFHNELFYMKFNQPVCQPRLSFTFLSTTVFFINVFLASEYRPLYTNPASIKLSISSLSLVKNSGFLSFFQNLLV